MCPVQSETCVRSSSPSHRLLTSFSCCSSSWLFLLCWVRKHIIFVTFHGIICSHILNWTAVIVFSEWRIFLHYLCDHCVFSLQVSASSLRTPPTQYVECWISKCGCNRRVMFSVCNSYFSMLLSHPSTSAPWKTALSVCLCCWPQQSKIIISSTQLFSVLHILTRTHTTC